MNALLITAQRHSRLITEFDGITNVSDVELLSSDIGWSVRVTITTNQDGWYAIGLLKQAGADILVESCEPDFRLRIGVARSCSEEFHDSLLEVVHVEQWLAKAMPKVKR